jgi:predicted transcriptional regulator
MSQFKDIENNDNFSKLGFFSGEPYLKYIFKKTEKIVAALYLVSNLLKDKEPIKWRLREKSMSLMSSVLVLNDEQSFDKDYAVRALFSDAIEILSTISLAHIGGLLSSMNYEILRTEIEKVVSVIKDNVTLEKEAKGYVLSENFFKEDLIATKKVEKENQPIKDNSQPVQKKNNRQEVILDLLRTKSNLTVKDVAQVVTNCSEKTIQRELIYLVDKGVVKREGERRWSRYSLK